MAEIRAAIKELKDAGLVVTTMFTFKIPYWIKKRKKSLRIQNTTDYCKLNQNVAPISDQLLEGGLSNKSSVHYMQLLICQMCFYFAFI